MGKKEKRKNTAKCINCKSKGQMYIINKPKMISMFMIEHTINLNLEKEKHDLTIVP
ncbi:hypothetical protein Syun_019789 [Stephania yunnanensis]|uniref:Uncharacterized protein n=1 Tax=Stephania yunnanensis TaxID=152371 RepID=A0AAP0IUN8_9MAGN